MIGPSATMEGGKAGGSVCIIVDGLNGTNMDGAGAGPCCGPTKTSASGLVFLFVVVNIDDSKTASFDDIVREPVVAPTRVVPPGPVRLVPPRICPA